MKLLSSAASLPLLNVAKRWTLAVALGIGVIVVRPWFSPSIGQDMTFILAYPAVVLAAWYGGAGPGLLTGAIALVGYLSLVVMGVLSNTAVTGRALVFAIGTIAIAAMGEQVQRARAALRARAEAAEERARLAAEREAALTETRRQASVLQSIMDYVPEGITVAWGPEANIALVSRHGLSLIQKSPAAVAGIPAAQHPQAWEIYTPDGAPVLDPSRLPLTRACLGEVTKNVELLIRATDGRLIPILCDAGPIRNARDEVVGGIIAWRDISKRKRAEAALHDALQRLELLLDHTPLAVVEWDEKFRVTRWAGEAERLFGWSAQEVVGKGMDELGIVHPDDAAAVADTAARLGSGNERYVVSHNRNVTKAGEVVSCVWYNSVLPKTQGGMQAILSLVLDVTEQERTQQQLALANATKDTFLATLAHELRNPLAPLRTTAVMLRAKTANDESMAALSSVVERQVNQMSRLLDDLLDVSRITLNRLELRLEPTNIAEVLDAAIEQTRTALDTAQQTLVSDIPQDLPAIVLADRARLTQAFANILQNAAKYSAGPGKVRIGVRLEQRQVHVDIEDSGVGIAPDALESIFNLFVQAPTLVRPQAVGLGIGLALVRGVVELHGGSVVARSEGPGTGSTFRVTLPRSDATVLSPPAPTNPPLTSYLGTRRLNVLVVDDNRDAADSLAGLLRMLGHTVGVSYNGQEGLARVAAKQPDVVMLDIGLPDMNGYELAQQIRATSAGRNMLLIAITGWAEEEHQAATKAAGFDHHFAKPVEIEPLLDLLSAYARGKGPESPSG